MGIKVGFIGTGGISYFHAEALERLGETEIVAAYDINADGCKKFCDKFGGRVCRSIDELVSIPDLNAVYICTYHDTHTDIAEAVMERGKAFLLEKPVAMRFKDAKAICEKQLETNILCAAGFNMRLSPVMRDFKRLLKEKDVEPLAFRVSMVCSPFIGGWCADPVTGGGVLTCVGSHMLDLIPHVLGSEITAIYTQTRHIAVPDSVEPDGAAIVLELENGLCGTLLINDRGEYGYCVEPAGKMVDLTVYSDRGTFQAEAYNKIIYADKDGFHEITPPGDWDRCYRWGYEEENRQFIGLLKGEKTELCSLAEGARVAAVVDAARLSALENRRVEIKEVGI